MENRNEDIIKTLNNLIEVNYDRSKGYETAAKDTEDAEHRTMFHKYSSQSMAFKNELESLVRVHGGEPRESSSAEGAVHRAWIETKSVLTGKDKKAIISSCEFGEDAAKKIYSNARKDAVAFPNDVLSVINRQHDEIVKAHDTIKSLRDSLVEHPH